MPYPLPENVRELRDTVRRFVDEVAIPRELEAEMDPEAARAHRAGNMEWAKRNGLWAMTLPAANVSQTFDDQRESLIVMGVISTQSEELKAQNEIQNRQLVELTQMVRGLERTHGNAS